LVDSTGRCDEWFAARRYLVEEGSAVTFRSRLFWLFTFFVLLAVGIVAAGVTFVTRNAFEQLDARRTDALVAQFREEFKQRGDEAALQVKGIADAEATTRMAIELMRPNADASTYYWDARNVASAHQLDILDFVATDGTIISSAEWPARAGYKLSWVTKSDDWASAGPFLTRMDTQEGPMLGLMAVANAVPVADKRVYVVGGKKLGKDFISTLALSEGMRALVYLNLDKDFSSDGLLDANGAVQDAERFSPLVEQVRQAPKEQTAQISWSSDPASAEVFHLLPLAGRDNELLGVLLIGASQRERVVVEHRIILLAVGVAGLGLLLGAILSWWGAARITQPVTKLVNGAREVAAGNWNARVDLHSKDDIGQLAAAFNQMTEELVDQRDRLVQSERVAAWRELARRLAHELKNPLFPLQITVENLRRARMKNTDDFDEIFDESTETLLAEIENLKGIIGRFSDFARMPRPELRTVDVNEVVRTVVRLFEAQFSAVGRPPITPELHLEANLPHIQADPLLLHRAIENLVLNAMDAMPSGGVLAIATSTGDGSVVIEIADTGSGLTKEECERLFTPYYTTKQHGTGLGLAVVQSVISDHGGTISVESESGVGTTFRIVLMIKPAVETAKSSKAAATAPPSQAQQPAALLAAPAQREPDAPNETSDTAGHDEVSDSSRDVAHDSHEPADAAQNSAETISTSEPEA
jgi:two-component system nitrogen regulation sensor histidine kinase NtrY